MLKQSLKTKLTEAIKTKNESAKSCLRVVLGELDRTNKDTDQHVISTIRKVIDNNDITIAQLNKKPEADARVTILEEENAFLTNLIPPTLSLAEIINNLQELKDKIKAAKATGQAMGMAIKHLNGLSLNFNATDVSLAIQQIREN